MAVPRQACREVDVERRQDTNHEGDHLINKYQKTTKTTILYIDFIDFIDLLGQCYL